MQIPEKSLLERCLDADELVAASAGMDDHDPDHKSL